MEGIADHLKQAPPHVCYHAKFGRSSLKNVVIDTGEPQKLRNTGALPLWEGAVAHHLKTSPSPYMLPRQIW